MGCVNSKPSQGYDKAKQRKVNMIRLAIKAPLPQCAIEDHVPTEHHPTICTILLEAFFDFQSTNWQQALGCFPEPQVQMVRVIRNCSENTTCNVVLTLTQSSGVMQFVDNLDQFSTEELFFWVAKEELGVQTKYLLVNANRTYVICIQHPDVVAEYKEARRRPTMGAQQFHFNIQSVTYHFQSAPTR